MIVDADEALGEGSDLGEQTAEKVSTVTWAPVAETLSPCECSCLSDGSPAQCHAVLLPTPLAYHIQSSVDSMPVHTALHADSYVWLAIQYTVVEMVPSQGQG